MSDPDAMPDPIDKAYVEAEAVLSDEAARVARRAKVLATIAAQGPADAAGPAARPRAWRRGGWLVAASVAGLALVVATQFYRPPAYAPPTKPIAGPVASGPATRGSAVSAQASPARASPVPASPVRASPVPASPVRASPARASPARESSAEVRAPAPPAEIGPPAMKSQAEPAPIVVAQSPAPPAVVAGAGPTSQAETAPPQPPRPADAASERASSDLAASQPRNAVSTGEIVVTAEKRQSRSLPGAISAFIGRRLNDPGARLRSAAAAGRIADVEGLLEQGVPIDAPDANGDTALMKSIRADRPAAAALLLEHGASLDQRNHAGENAKDLARTKNDPELNQAIGLSP